MPLRKNLSHEWSLVLQTISSGIDRDDHLDDKFEVHSAFSEQLFLSLVNRHRIAPLVYSCLSKKKYVSGSLNTALRKVVETDQVRSLSASRFLILSHDFCNSNGIPIVFLKGVLLAQEYYGDVGMRASIDIDVWVSKHYFVIFTNWLRSIGYRSYEDQEALTVKQASFLRKYSHEIVFISDDPSLPAIVELHTSLTSSTKNFNYNFEEKYSELPFVYLFERNFRTMEKADQLLFLCLHGSQHGWHRLKWISDILQCITTFDFKWSFVAKRAKELGCLVHLNVALSILNKLFMIEVPELFKPATKSLRVKLLVSYSLRSMRDLNYSFDLKERQFLHFLYSILLSPSVIFSGTIMKYMTSKADWKLIKIHDKYFSAYFLFRPFFILYRGVINLFF